MHQGSGQNGGHTLTSAVIDQRGKGVAISRDIEDSQIAHRMRRQDTDAVCGSSCAIGTPIKTQTVCTTQREGMEYLSVQIRQVVALGASQIAGGSSLFEHIQ